MAYLRVSFFLLVFANLIFFAWTQGYFGTSTDGREPQRLEQQLHPEKLRVVYREPQSPTAAKSNTGTTCRLVGVGGMPVADAEALKAATEAEGWETKLVPLKEPSQQVILIADLASKAMAEKKAGELRLLGVTDFVLGDLGNNRYEIVLGRFETATAAQEYFQVLAKKNVRSAKLDVRDQPPLKARIEVSGPADTLTRKLPDLVSRYPGVTTSNCGN